MLMAGAELAATPGMSFMERAYCSIFGAPIVGLRIRLRRVKKILPVNVSNVLDAGCGRGVITRMLARHYPKANIVGLDSDVNSQEANIYISDKIKLTNCTYDIGDLSSYVEEDKYDLIVSVDNLEHIENDVVVLNNFYKSLSSSGFLVIHVPCYYRRWPVFKWKENFDVPGHYRPGYHMPDLESKIKSAGFVVKSCGYDYAFLENLTNNISYIITGAEQKNKYLYALLFPILNTISFFGQWSNPKKGAGIWFVASKGDENSSIS